MNDHRQLRVWISADALVRQVHPIVADFNSADRWTLGNQLWRAALSVPCNIVEGYSRSSPKQLLYHLNVSLGSLTEATYLLELAMDLKIASGQPVQSALATARDLRPPLLAFVSRIHEGGARHSRFEGNRAERSPNGTGRP